MTNIEEAILATGSIDVVMLNRFIKIVELLENVKEIHLDKDISEILPFYSPNVLGFIHGELDISLTHPLAVFSSIHARAPDNFSAFEGLLKNISSTSILRKDVKILEDKISNSKAFRVDERNESMMRSTLYKVRAAKSYKSPDMVKFI